jgi:hypothetical protein
MLGNVKTALVCIVIVSIFGCAYLSAFSLPSGAQAENGSRIYGTVLDMNGHGVDQATVKLIKSDGLALNIPDNPTNSGDGETNPYGFYQFNGSYSGTSTIIAAGTYQVSVSKDGHTGSASVTVNGNDAYSINVMMSDYVQPSVTPVPTATPSPTPAYRASATVIEAPPTVIHPVVTPDANATAVPSASAVASVAANATASVNSTASAANVLPVAGSFMGAFMPGMLAVLGTMAIVAAAKNGKILRK